ncbi:hypothetical protein RN001_012878 [Aquatica leii]|uniref:Uncharacterized protein n=1 Tax=Aquatica leii TaxID=1421715 RepID=A0AAN7P813_9COLE|nr:hypothetical protein RN001_012878 [Aquatica leii]
MAGVYSTAVNFSTLGLLRRLSKIQTINEFVTDTGDLYTFLRENISSKLGTGEDNDRKELPTVNKIKEVVLKAKSDALTNCLAVGLNTTDEALSTIHIKSDMDDNEIKLLVSVINDGGRCIRLGDEATPI